jgi:peptidoglycan/LPS O-acetylase OafA/YrhL
MPLTIEPLRWIAHFFYSIPFTSFAWLNDIFWTLGIEMQYYIFIGFVFPLLNHSNQIIRYLPILLMLGMCFILPDERIFTFYAIPFSFGFLFYFLKTNKINTMNFALLSLILLLLNNFILHANYWQLGFILIAFGVLFFEKPIWKFLSRLGDISYSFYLTHGLSGGTFLYFTHYRVYSLEAKFSLFLIALGISLLFASVFYRIIEVPSRKWASTISWR